MKTTWAFLVVLRLSSSFSLKLLSEFATPTVVVELSQLEANLPQSFRYPDEKPSLAAHRWLQATRNRSLDADTSTNTEVLQSGTVFLSCQITSTAIRDAVDSRFGSGKARSIASLDVGAAGSEVCQNHKPSSLYLGLGLANHHVGGYYWGRSLGAGAAAPALGVECLPSATPATPGATPGDGSGRWLMDLCWTGRRRARRLKLQQLQGGEEPEGGGGAAAAPVNSNDGKRSEWVDFLRVGDTVQLVPADGHVALALLRSAERIVAVRREGRPRGAEPAVEFIVT